ncbi:hypothetical protein ACCO45_012513 [Purpureocillium lilacinum]|uniref:Uncharacterized protein n=1 Tax=Purpureocillium lilacinum TaxID=33203 RepID=A0ACC4D883_PURLI
MKASIVILALIQGLATATPVRSSYQVLQGQVAGFLDREQRATAHESPMSIDDQIRVHQEHVLPARCFGKDEKKTLHSLCSRVYFDCADGCFGSRDKLFGMKKSTNFGKWQPESKLKLFQDCVDTRLIRKKPASNTAKST